MSGVYIFFYNTPGLFVAFGALDAQKMYRPVYVPVNAAVHFVQQGNNLLRFLSSGGIVQVDQRFPVYFLFQGREDCPDIRFIHDPKIEKSFRMVYICVSLKATDMYEYITGTLTAVNPTQAVVETGGIGYDILISLQTYSLIHKQTEIKLWIHLLVREDAQLLYGFATRDEREIFRRLISVSGVGPNTARMILSAMSNKEIRNALMTGDVARIKSIKGIGTKTAERMIIELKDKMVKLGLEPGDEPEPVSTLSDTVAEASSALQLLGFAKANVEKVLGRLYKEEPSGSLEDLIKRALKLL